MLKNMESKKAQKFEVCPFYGRFILSAFLRAP